MRLHRLLSLDLELEDPRWMHLHPDSEAVIEVCLMTDELARLLKQCEDCGWGTDNWAGRRSRNAETPRAA